jgi:hypothetical protein
VTTLATVGGALTCRPPGRLAGRALDLLVELARPMRDRGVLLVPALYCAEVADALSSAGCALRSYDVPADLSPPRPAISTDVAGLVWHHPFGIWHPPPMVPPGVRVIEDACFSLRTLFARGHALGPWPIVTSLRKEFGWPAGGWLSDLTAPAPATAHVPADLARRWSRTCFGIELAAGLAATLAARAKLGTLLPAVQDDRTVLTMLPLLSEQRDDVVHDLRSVGRPAWCWLRPMPGCTPDLTPDAWTLHQQMFLLELPEVGAETLDLLNKIRLKPWPPPVATARHPPTTPLLPP